MIARSCDGNDAVVQVFFIRGGKLIGREHFHLNVAVQEEKGQILEKASILCIPERPTHSSI